MSAAMEQKPVAPPRAPVVFAYAWGGRYMSAPHEPCPTCGAHMWGKLNSGAVGCWKCHHA